MKSDERKEEFQPVAKVGEIPIGQAKVVHVRERPIALFNVAGAFYAIYNVCPHAGGPLGEGRLKGYSVSCPWHDLAFDVRTGQASDGGGSCVGSYEVCVKGDDVCIGARRKF